MTKNNQDLRKKAQLLSPTQSQRSAISELYICFQKALGGNKLIQVGSYARKTAIQPLHDLDILYRLEAFDPENKSKSATDALKTVGKDIKNGFIKPSFVEDYDIAMQTHSVGITFKCSNELGCFSVDVVPAIPLDRKNEYEKSIYLVPEILRHKRSKREEFYTSIFEQNKSIDWIESDPEGYTCVAIEIDKGNPDFRKTVKLLKSIKNDCKAHSNSEFKLKSFHIEQMVTEEYQQNKEMIISDCITDFLNQLPQKMKHACIRDRVGNKYIDEYINKLSAEEKATIISLMQKECKKLLSNNNMPDTITPITPRRIYGM